jgi:hypothetical protein
VGVLELLLEKGNLLVSVGAGLHNLNFVSLVVQLLLQEVNFAEKGSCVDLAVVAGFN